jgi:hypothetical protein
MFSKAFAVLLRQSRQSQVFLRVSAALRDFFGVIRSGEPP